MNIIEDTRQQEGKHELKNDYFKCSSIKVVRCKLPVGDYALFPKVSIDTKKDMDEIAANISGAQHVRFREECKLAQSMGCKLIILVENMLGIKSIEDVERWENPRRLRNPKSIDGARLRKAMNTMNERYGVEFMFCEPSEAGQIIERILSGYEETERADTD